MAGCVGKVGSNGSGFPGVWEYRGPMTDPPDDRRAMSSSRTIQPRKVSLFSNNSFPMWKYCDPCPENMNTVSDAGTKDPFLRYSNPLARACSSCREAPLSWLIPKVRRGMPRERLQPFEGCHHVGPGRTPSASHRATTTTPNL